LIEKQLPDLYQQFFILLSPLKYAQVWLGLQLLGCWCHV